MARGPLIHRIAVQGRDATAVPDARAFHAKGRMVLGLAVCHQFSNRY